MGLLQVARLAVFGTLAILSIIVLGLDAHLIAKYTGDRRVGRYVYHIPVPAWTALGVAVSVITFVSIVPMAVIDVLRKNALTSLVYVELVWFGILWVLWLSAFADDAANATLCNENSGGGDVCNTIRASEAFSFLAFAVAFGYWLALLVLSIISSSKGNTGVWRSSAGDPDFGTSAAPAAASVAPADAPPMQQQNHAQYPPPTASPHPTSQV